MTATGSTCRPIRGVMTPRTEVDWLDLTTSEEELRRVLITTQHSRLPAGDAIDELVGVVQPHPPRPAIRAPATDRDGLREAIAMLLEEGLEQVFARHQRLAAATRAARANRTKCGDCCSRMRAPN